MTGCSTPAPLPSKVIVAARLPAGWPTPRAVSAGAAPQLIAARFSSLDLALGDRWSGDLVVTTDVRRVRLKTNLWIIEATRVGDGRFRFAENLEDLPAFLVRPYNVDIVMIADDGRLATVPVPMRIGGRPLATP